MYAGPLPDIAVTIFKSASFFTHKISPTELKISETVFFEFVMSLTELPNNHVMLSPLLAHKFGIALYIFRKF